MIPQEALYDAAMKAANQIEAFPDTFAFHSIEVPEEGGWNCGTPGCALGWMATFLMLDGVIPYNRQLGRVWEPIEDQVSTMQFYKRMNELQHDAGRPNWIDDAQSCAATLRDYATELLEKENVNITKNLTRTGRAD